MNTDVSFSIAQFRDAWNVLCRACAGFVTYQAGGVEYIFSGVPIPFFNVALVTAAGIPAGELEAQARAACLWAADKAVPWMFVVTHEALARGVDAASTLEPCGLVPMLPLTGMRTHDVVAPARRTNGLDVGVADDDAACAAVFDVNSAAYGADLDMCKPTFGKRSFWQNHVLSLGRVEGRPVSSAAVLMVDGYRYVALVATTPDQQRRGYGEAAMRHALGVAAVTYGDAPTTLHATDAGRPIYERMGYQPIATHTAFIEKRFLEGH
jgi:GNAT superfamily N-acetyltransferase